MTSLHHIAFHCHDIHAQEKFYTKHFGFKRVWTFNQGQVNEFFLIRLGDCRLEFFSAPEGTPGEVHGGEQTIGMRHLAFGVDKLEPIIEGLKEDGIITDPIISIDSVPGLRICFFRDPEGNILEMMEDWPANA